MSNFLKLRPRYATVLLSEMASILQEPQVNRCGRNDGVSEKKNDRNSVGKYIQAALPCMRAILSDLSLEDARARSQIDWCVLWGRLTTKAQEVPMVLAEARDVDEHMKKQTLKWKKQLEQNTIEMLRETAVKYTDVSSIERWNEETEKDKLIEFILDSWQLKERKEQEEAFARRQQLLESLCAGDVNPACARNVELAIAATENPNDEKSFFHGLPDNTPLRNIQLLAAHATTHCLLSHEDTGIGRLSMRKKRKDEGGDLRMKKTNLFCNFANPTLHSDLRLDLSGRVVVSAGGCAPSKLAVKAGSVTVEQCEQNLMIVPFMCQSPAWMVKVLPKDSSDIPSMIAETRTICVPGITKLGLADFDIAMTTLVPNPDFIAKLSDDGEGMTGMKKMLTRKPTELEMASRENFERQAEGRRASATDGTGGSVKRRKLGSTEEERVIMSDNDDMLVSDAETNDLLVSEAERRALAQHLLHKK